MDGHKTANAAAQCLREPRLVTRPASQNEWLDFNRQALATEARCNAGHQHQHQHHVWVCI